jgi:hypothetical protein
MELAELTLDAKEVDFFFLAEVPLFHLTGSYVIYSGPFTLSVQDYVTVCVYARDASGHHTIIAFLCCAQARAQLIKAV